jgi:hypothetical protein
MRYTLRHWEGLTRFLNDGRLELDTNTVEREIRPITLGRKNALFAGEAGAVASTTTRTPFENSTVMATGAGATGNSRADKGGDGSGSDITAGTNANLLLAAIASCRHL